MLNLQVALSGKVPDPLGVTPEGWSPSPSDPSLSHFAPSDTPAEREGLKRMTSTGRLRDAPLRRVITITEGPCTRNKGTAWKSWCRRVFGRVLHKWHEADIELSTQVFVYPEDSGQLARRAAIAVCSAARCTFRSEHRAVIESSQRFSGEITRLHGVPRRPSRQKYAGARNSERDERASMAFPSPRTKVRQPVTPCSQPLGEHESRQSAACGSPPRRAYRPYGRRGRVAEGGGLLNRYRVVKPYRGFESLRLRQFAVCLSGWASHFVAKA